MVAENVGAQPGPKPQRVEQRGFGAKANPIPLPSSLLKGNESPADKTAVFYGPVYSYYEFEVIYGNEYA
jgi:hypothetical protein